MNTQVIALLLLIAAACSEPPATPAADGGAPTVVDGGEAFDGGAAQDGAAPFDGGSSSSDGGANDGGAAPDAGAGDAGLGPTPTALGATVTATGVVFRVWAPHASAAWVAGDFAPAPTPMSAEDGGTFVVDVAQARAGNTYRFELAAGATTLRRLDPYCRQLTADGGACTVVDPAAYPWQSPPLRRPTRRESVVYELHIGSFTTVDGGTPGTFASARERLADLADLGVNVIELLPVQAFAGRGWGYSPQLYFAPKPSYGTSDELRAFVDAAHGRGIAVWLDTVVNHMDGSRQAPLACFDGDCPGGAYGVFYFPPGPYATTPWGPRPHYAEPRVTAMLLDAAKQWLTELGGDGFRWDSVSNIRGVDGVGTTPGGREFLIAANDLTHAAGALSVAEDLKGYAALTQPTADGGFGFDAQWDGFGYDIPNLLAPASDDGRDLGVVESQLRGGYNGDGFARVLWTENHDTVGNGGARLPSRIDAAAPESFAARRRSMLAATLLFTTPGVPMLFMGQERLATGTFTNPPAPLAAPTATGLRVRAFYQTLIALRRNLGGQAGGLQGSAVQILHRHDANQVIAYRRTDSGSEEVVVVLNLRNRAYTRYDVGVPTGGTWRVRLDSDWTSFGDDFTGGQTGPISTLTAQKDGQPYTLPVRLPAYGAVVLSR